MTSISSIQLRTVQPVEIANRIVPSVDAIRENCVQWIMRDYADVADAMNDAYAEMGGDAYDSEEYVYMNDLRTALGTAIRITLR